MILIDQPSSIFGSKYELEALAPPSLTHPPRGPRVHTEPDSIVDGRAICARK